ncbi:class I SAM-dependent methyltransferase [Speluncibacter jeojiensis]|uniref:Class I SAM-dependent methyltransferase n=1 Tax=Speluncibacter jeojiensis TaxID=2710754 RepID=A0A9X4M5D2_9ACTN|nr:class I SAM-dependent methyltransferase [Corynebacteriales bacterium D3-21]
MRRPRHRIRHLLFVLPRGPLGRLGARIMARANAPVERELARAAHAGRDDTVLVIGPGPGVGAAALARTARRVIAVDPSPLMLRHTGRRLERLRRTDLAVELYRATAAHTGVASGSVDVVVSGQNVMLWPDRAAGFAEQLRVLRPGGRMLVSSRTDWLGDERDALPHEMRAAGFVDVQTWTWRSGRTVSVLFAARRP